MLWVEVKRDHLLLHVTIWPFYVLRKKTSPVFAGIYRIPYWISRKLSQNCQLHATQENVQPFVYDNRNQNEIRIGPVLQLSCRKWLHPVQGTHCPERASNHRPYLSPSDIQIQMAHPIGPISKCKLNINAMDCVCLTITRVPLDASAVLHVGFSRVIHIY